jgi:hypothetical protein
VSEIVKNTKPNGHLPHASSVSGALLIDVRTPHVPSVQGTGVSTGATRYERCPVVLTGGVEGGGVERAMRPATAAPVATKALANAPAFIAGGVDAQLFGQQKTQLFPMWALRGLDPWSEPT